MTIAKIAAWFGSDFSVPQFNVLLPVGISFYTFQALGYSIDVYRGTIKAERNFITYALFVTFFPQLVAGPIERTERLMPQFKVNHKFDYDRVTDGLRTAAWGMFMKVVVADRLAVFVNKIYGDVSGFSGVMLLLATFAFAVQVYADFNGYSTIAVGVAQVLGFDLMRNFERPYFSKSIPEYWRRWHISLSSWFRDYLYFPIVGSKWCNSLCKKIVKITGGGLKKSRLLTGEIALTVVWFTTGLWHGDAWHFVAWGLTHGFYQIVSLRTENLRRKLRIRFRLQENRKVKRGWQFVQMVTTFCLVCASYVFFRANSLKDALKAGKRILFLPREIFYVLLEILTSGISIKFGKDELFNCVTLFFVMVLFVVDLCTRNKRGNEIVRNIPTPVRWTLYWLLVFVILFFQNFEQTEFLYFQF